MQGVGKGQEVGTIPLKSTPVRNGRICASGKTTFFSSLWWEQYLWGLATDFLSLTAPHFCGCKLQSDRSATDLLQRRGACPPRTTYTEGATAPPSLAWWSSGDIVSCLLGNLCPVQGHWSTRVILTSIKCHCHFSESFPCSVQPACPWTSDMFFRLWGHKAEISLSSSFTSVP